MSFNPIAYEKAERELKNRRNAALDEYEQRRETALVACPEIADIERGIVSTWGEAARTAFSSTAAEQKKMLTTIRRRVKEGNALKEKLLVSCGFPKNFLEKKFVCKKCEDKGYIGEAERCDCLLRLIRQYSVEELNKTANLPQSDMRHFSLEYYRNIRDEKGRDCYKIMAHNLKLVEKYIEDFSLSSGNLIFTGKTGLGKTHLSLAIGKAIIEKGFIVMYRSAGNMLSEIDAERFGRAEPGFEKALADAELLIIDDLGAEGKIKNTKNEAYLYNIINTRINLNLPTIINTNIIKQNEMLEYYSERVVSRIYGCFTEIVFEGIDIRQKKTA
jgi:DNA replication protein DnaC